MLVKIVEKIANESLQKGKIIVNKRVYQNASHLYSFLCSAGLEGQTETSRNKFYQEFFVTL